MRSLLSIFTGCLALVCFMRCCHADGEGSSLTYEQDIRPIFRAYCFDCHGAADELRGELDLRLVRFMRTGGESGPAIVPGKPQQSYLLQRVRQGEMPPGDKKLPDEKIAIIDQWIAAGAPTARPEPDQITSGLGITPEERSYWAFQPVRRPDVPALDSFPPEARVRTPIDALILDAMPPGLAFSPDAERLTTVRRAFLILLGLPPSPEQMQGWLDDPRDDWYDRLITDLLDSPHYGERWARHWLDVAGYADSEGYTVQDPVREWAWKYRDWVIRAFNDDKPFDRFVIEQLAGDELAGPIDGPLTPAQIDLLTATGYLRMAADGTGSGDNSPAARNSVMTDTLKIVGSSLIGLSIHCAQCHDHRYDPILQTDYYAIRAIFEPALDWNAWRTPAERRVSLYTEEQRQQAGQIEAAAQKLAEEKQAKQDEFITEQLETNLLRVENETLREPLRAAYRSGQRTEEQKQLLAAYPFVRQLSPGSLYLYNKDAAEELKDFDKRIAEMRGKKPAEPFLRALIEPPQHVPETKLFHRGEFKQPRQTVRPAALTVSAPEHQRQEFPSDEPSLPTTGRRLAFGHWLTSGQHPLLARVTVNRLWMHHFGRALVPTPGEFGKLGTPPSHPELLDWLADEFVRQGWSWKKMHRIIMHSTVWRQSSEVSDPAQQASDPSNQYYGRKPIIRLEAETIRDRMLAASGQLDDQLFGSPIGVKKNDTGEVVVEGEQTRRSLYIQTRRTQPVAMLQAFDAPVMETNCDCRPVSAVATQSLILMNGPFIIQQAEKLARRTEQSAAPLSADQLVGLFASTDGFCGPPDSSETILGQVVRAWQLVYSRPPSEIELRIAAQFVGDQLELLHADDQAVGDGQTATSRAVTNLCHALLSSNEFLYVD